MAQIVYHGATLQCSFGTTPSALVVTPEKRVDSSGIAMATVMDFAPLKNVMPFNLCMTLTNPAVAAATAAKLGAFTPAPCQPVITAPWAPGSPTVTIRSQPALNNLSTCLCQWGGVITITSPGPSKVTAP